MTTVFLDSDGVLADFDFHFYNLFGVLTRDVTTDRLWNLIKDNPGFFRDMPVKTGAFSLVSTARRVSGRNPIIISGLPKPPILLRSRIEKRQFFKENFPNLQVILCMSHQKQEFMKFQGDVLVDDDIKNVERWKAAGGQAIFYRDAGQAVRDLNALFQNTVD